MGKRRDNAWRSVVGCLFIGERALILRTHSSLVDSVSSQVARILVPRFVANSPFHVCKFLKLTVCWWSKSVVLRLSKEDFYVRVVLMNKYEPSSRKLRCMIDRWYHAHRPKTCDDHRSALDTFLETNGPTLLFRLRSCSPSHPACIVHVQPKMR